MTIENNMFVIFSKICDLFLFHFPEHGHDDMINYFIKRENLVK